jgi:hypothetical protein
MSVLILPVSSEFNSQVFTVELESVIYEIRLRYNTRAAIWKMDIAKEDGTKMLSGIPVFSNSSITSQYANVDLPPGVFMAFDTEGEAKDPDNTDFGSRVKLLYQEAG